MTENDADEFELRYAHRDALEARAKEMSLEELAAEITRRCAEVLNNHGADLQAILDIADQFHQAGKFNEDEDYQLTKEFMELIRGAFEQLARLNGEGHYGPLGSQEALAILRKKIDKDYPFQYGTQYHVVDTYEQAVKPLMDSANSCACPEGDTSGMQKHFDALYAPVYDLMPFAGQMSRILESRIAGWENSRK